MAFNAGEIIGKLKADISGFKAGMTKAKAVTKSAVESMNNTIKSVTPALQKAALGFGVMGAAAGVALKDIVGLASDMNEVTNKTQEVFGNSSDVIIKKSKEAAQAVGASASSYLDMASAVGNLIVPMGIAKDEAANMSAQMVQVAADLGSFNNAKTEEVLDAIKAGLVGSSEPLRRFGIQLSVARIEQEALNSGLVTSKDQIDANVKAQATMNIIMRDSAAAQGDFARTSDGLANSSKTLSAKFADLRTEVGTALLPLFENLVQVGLKVLDWVNGLSPEMKKLAGFATLVATAIGLLLPPILIGITLIPALTILLGGFAAAMTFLSGPISLIIAAVVALYTAWQMNFFGIRDNTMIVLEELKFVITTWWQIVQQLFTLAQSELTQKWQAFWHGVKTITSNIFDGITTFGKNFWNSLLKVFNIGMNLLQSAWSTIMNGIANVANTIWDNIKNTFGSAINWLIGKLNEFIGMVNSVARYIPGLGKNVISPVSTVSFSSSSTPSTVTAGGGNAIFQRGAFEGSVISSEEAAMSIMDAAMSSMKGRLGV